jgi:hypothetical protein
VASTPSKRNTYRTFTSATALIGAQAEKADFALSLTSLA